MSTQINSASKNSLFNDYMTTCPRNLLTQNSTWRRTNDKWPFCHTRVFRQSISGFGLQTLSKIDLDFTFANPKFCLPFRFSCLVDWRPRMYNGLVGHRQTARCVIKSKTVVVVYSMLLNICSPKPYGHPLGLLNSQNTGICKLFQVLNINLEWFELRKRIPKPGFFKYLEFP